MHPKPFPPEKRASLALKPFEEFQQFFHELPRSLQEKIISDERPGFRQGSPAGRRINLQQLWSDTKKPESSLYERAWDCFERIWHSWVISQPSLQALLEKFDNSSDFQDNTSSPPNTTLDLECFRYLSNASIKGSVSQELIQKFYDFGYFQKDNTIEAYISLARSEQDLKQRSNLVSRLQSIEDDRETLYILQQKIEEIFNESRSEKVWEHLGESLKDSERQIISLQERLAELHIVASRLAIVEQQLIELKNSTENSIQQQQNTVSKIINEAQTYAEDIELLRVVTDDNIRNVEELRKSWSSLAAASPFPLVPTDTVTSDTPNVWGEEPTTPPVYECDAFLQHRLLPALEKWLPDITPRWAELFHHAIWACLWVLVPNQAWAVAYHEAMGETAQLHIVQVEPTWLCFADAWRAVEPTWEAARQQPDCLHLLLFEDVNRALPECWARPWLDMVAGFRKVLPVDGHPGWPANLRILACLALDQAALPLSKTVVQHWAAVSLQAVGQPSAEPAQLHAGHVPWVTWQSWGIGEEITTFARSQMKSRDREDATFDWSSFGPLAHSVARDFCRLEASMRHLHPDIESLLTAKNMRITWPQEYRLLQETADE